MSDTTGPRGAGRIAWIDTARGITMIMVVLLHTDVVAEAVGRASLPVTLFNSMLFPMRMPMFFLVAGLLAAGLLRRSAGEVLRRRVLHYAWLYALWFALYALLHRWVMGSFGPPEFRAYYNHTGTVPEALLVTWNNVWFLYALMLFFAVALAIRRLPLAAQGAIALLLALPGCFQLGAEYGLPVIDRFYHFPYFILGILATAPLRAAVPKLGRVRVLLPLLLAWLGLAAGAHVLRILRDPLVIATLSLLAVPAGLGMAAWLADRLPRLAAPLQVIGRNTLGIYVLHTVTLRPLLTWWATTDIPGILAIPVLTLAALGLALALGKVLEPVPFLFGLPRLGLAGPAPARAAQRGAEG